MAIKKQALPPINHALKAVLPPEILELPKALRIPEDYSRDTTVLETLNIPTLEKYHRSQLREFDLETRQFIKKTKSLSKKDVKDLNKYRTDLKVYLEVQQRDEIMEMKRILDVSEEDIEVQKKILKEKKQLQAEKKREKELELKQERERLMKEAENNPNSAKNIEIRAIEEALKEHGKTIKDIEPDGHCLYRSIADQINNLDFPLPPHLLGDEYKDGLLNYKAIRKICADSLLASKESFLPFVGIDVDFDKYVEDVASSAEWGGQIELQAFSNAAGIEINVVQYGSPAILSIKPWEGETNDKLFLVYHKHLYALGEHYNSVRDI